MITIGEQVEITFKGRTMIARMAGCDLSDGWVAFYVLTDMLRAIVEEKPAPGRMEGGSK